jgi:hypothetical protein
MLYVWPPAGTASPFWQMSPWGEPVVPPQWPLPQISQARESQVADITSGGSDAPIGELSMWSDLFVFNGTSYLTIDNIVLTTARNAAVRAINTTSIIVSNAVVQNLGSSE